MRFSHKSRTLKYARCSKIASSLVFIKISRSLIKQTILRLTVSDAIFLQVTYAQVRSIAQTALWQRQSPPRVIQRSETTWESPKKKRKPLGRLSFAAFVLAISPRNRYTLSVRVGIKTQSTVSLYRLLGICACGASGKMQFACYARVRITVSDAIFSQVTYAPLLKRHCGGNNRAVRHVTKQVIARNCGLSFCPSRFESEDDLCGVEQ